jgi:hypothetical protein
MSITYFLIQSKKLGYSKEEAEVQSFIDVTFYNSGPLTCDKWKVHNYITFSNQLFESLTSYYELWIWSLRAENKDRWR